MNQATVVLTDAPSAPAGGDRNANEKFALGTSAATGVSVAAALPLSLAANALGGGLGSDAAMVAAVVFFLPLLGALVLSGMNAVVTLVRWQSLRPVYRCMGVVPVLVLLSAAVGLEWVPLFF